MKILRGNSSNTGYNLQRRNLMRIGTFNKTDSYYFLTLFFSPSENLYLELTHNFLISLKFGFQFVNKVSTNVRDTGFYQLTITQLENSTPI